DDSEASVAFQVALSLGQFDNAAVVANTLAKLAATYGHDARFCKAILSSRAGSSYAVYNQLQHVGFFAREDGGNKKFAEELAYVMAARGDVADYKRLFGAFPVTDEGYETAIVGGFANGIQKATL